MKNFQQNLLIIFAVALCLLCAIQWRNQARQQNAYQQRGQIVSEQLAAIQGYTNTISALQTQLAQADLHIGELRATIRTNDEFILVQKRQINAAEAENQGLTNDVAQYRAAVDTLQSRLKEASDGIQKQNDAIKQLAAQRDDFVQKLNASVKDRNDIVAKYNDLAARFEKLAPKQQ
jgi:chromosome segregation ATPase